MSRPTPEDLWESCPIHTDCWFPPGQCCPRCWADAQRTIDECPADHGQPCPACDPGEWLDDDVVGLGPEPPAGPHDPGRSDGWYLDLVARASDPGHDPHDPWRD